MTLSIILPCYNEQEAVSSVLDSILAWKNHTLKVQNSKQNTKALLSEIEIIVVNDGSIDSSSEILKKYLNEVIVVEHSKNLGYGAALKTGFSKAKNDWICFFDFDKTCHPEDIIPLLKKAIREKNHHIIGNRLNSKSKMPFHRKVGNYFFLFLCLGFFRKNKVDTCSGFRLFRKELIPELKDLPNGLNFSLAMTLIAFDSPQKLIQENIQYSERLGQSKLKSLTHGFEFTFTILKFALKRQF